MTIEARDDMLQEVLQLAIRRGDVQRAGQYARLLAHNIRRMEAKHDSDHDKRAMVTCHNDVALSDMRKI